MAGDEIIDYVEAMAWRDEYEKTQHLYHVTAPENVWKIQLVGLLANVPNEGAQAEGGKPAIWFCTSLDYTNAVAGQSAALLGKTAAVYAVFQVNKDRLNRKYMRWDAEEFKAYSFYYLRPKISPRLVKFVGLFERVFQ